MRLEDIALGGTYQIDTAFVRNCPVRVDAIDVHHVGEYQRLEQVWATALVWVYELQGGPRYPISLQAFRSGSDECCGRPDGRPRLARGPR